MQITESTAPVLAEEPSAYRACLLDHLVRGDVTAWLLCPRLELQLLWLALQLLGGRAGRTGVSYVASSIGSTPATMNRWTKNTASPRRNDMAGLRRPRPPPGGSQQSSQRGFQEATQQGLCLVHRRLCRFRVGAGRVGANGSQARVHWLTFLAATVLLYAGIGFMSRTSDASEYYVAGRRVPAIYNGMATGSPTGCRPPASSAWRVRLYLTWLQRIGLHHGLDWRLLLGALFLLAPYLRKFGQFTIPDFLGRPLRGQPAAHHRRVCGHPVSRSCTWWPQILRCGS